MNKIHIALGILVILISGFIIYYFFYRKKNNIENKLKVSNVYDSSSFYTNDINNIDNENETIIKTHDSELNKQSKKHNQGKQAQRVQQVQHAQRKKNDTTVGNKNIENIENNYGNADNHDNNDDNCDHDNNDDDRDNDNNDNNDDDCDHDNNCDHDENADCDDDDNYDACADGGINGNKEINIKKEIIELSDLPKISEVHKAMNEKLFDPNKDIHLFNVIEMCDVSDSSKYKLKIKKNKKNLINNF